jgi:hypothetical protein
MPSDRELDHVADAIDEARDAVRAERDSRPFDGSGAEPDQGRNEDGEV